uniref:RNase H type-1 domain-containing protein n=1 Tax=Cannabis sativa TaxID=3483 RepID=A0A803PEX7_CANSA
MTSTGGVMELYAPITVSSITDEFPGHAIFRRIQSPNNGDLVFSDPLLPNDHLNPGKKKKKKKNLMMRKMMKKNGSRVWRVKLAICPQQLTQILSRDAPTLALIDSVRTVAKCGGMPTFVGKNKKQIFGKIREKVEAKLQGWKMVLFSQAGKEILIKAVIQVIPCYVMSCFRITKGIIHEIESLIARFWWGSTSNKHKIHWGNWRKLCKLKENGGMGFRDLEDFNQSILAKQGWKLITEPDCLLSRVLKALYFPNETFFEANLGHFGSSVWKGILWGRDLLAKGYRWCVGNGAKIRVNEDPWLPRQIPFHLRTKVPIPKDVTLNSLITANGDWKINEVNSWFHKDDIPWVLGIIPSTHNPDWITWGLTNNGKYSVASGYKLRFNNPDWAACSNNSKLRAWWKFIWGSSLTPKMKNFIWKVFNHWLPTKVDLRKRGMDVLTICDICLQQEENITHALWCCPTVQKTWKRLGYSKLKDCNIHSASEFLWWQWEHLSKEEFIRFVGFTWLIWQRRNQFVFQHRNPNITYWVPWAIETLDQHLGLQHHDPSNSQPKSSSTWTPPPHGMLLINTDASLVQGQEGCGISAAIRNDRGALIVAKTRYIPGCMAVNLAEAAAIHLGIQLAEKWSIKNAWVASDSKIIISAIVNGSSSQTDWGQLVKTIIQMKTQFQSLQFLFYTRNCNKLANCLARWSRVTQKSEMRTDSLPPCAAACLIADVPSAA